MGKKVKVLISEQDFTELLKKYFLNGEEGDILGTILKGFKKEPEKKDSTTKKSESEFSELDLNNPEHYDAYEKIADKFISSRGSNLLGIKGSMLADAAKKAQNQHGVLVPVELSLAQLAAEGGFSSNPKDRPIRTKNPYNVGNVDSGKNVFHTTVQSGIDSYYSLMARNYLGGGKTAEDLLKNFVNKSGQRYADKEYENLVSPIYNKVKSIGQPIYASLIKSNGEKLT